MPQQPATLTDRLANVIEVIQLGRKTGILAVERGEGSTFERGLIAFAKGQVTQASVGQRNGFAAFNVLKTWGACRFSFTPSATSQTTQPLATVKENTSTLRDLATDPTLRTQATAGNGRTGSAGGQGTNRVTQPDTSTSGVPYPIRPLEETLLQIERMGLSRTHRRLFLLVDGHRTRAELVRLMGRGEEEVYALLLDLEWAGVIQQT